MDRRSLLRGLVALPTAACVMTTPARAASPDAELIAVAAELEAVYQTLDRWNRDEIELSDDQSDGLCERGCELADRLADVSAVTPEGIRAKASATWDVIASRTPHDGLVLSTLNDVLAVVA